MTTPEIWRRGGACGTMMLDSGPLVDRVQRASVAGELWRARAGRMPAGEGPRALLGKRGPGLFVPPYPRRATPGDDDQRQQGRERLLEHDLGRWPVPAGAGLPSARVQARFACTRGYMVAT